MLRRLITVFMAAYSRGGSESSHYRYDKVVQDVMSHRVGVDKKTNQLVVEQAIPDVSHQTK